jgi:hypothetical protein
MKLLETSKDALTVEMIKLSDANSLMEDQVTLLNDAGVRACYGV